MRSQTRAVLFMLGAGFAAPLAAQQDTTKPAAIDTLTVTAERRTVSTRATATTVRVLTRKELLRRAAPDLLTQLTEIPGVQLDQVVGSGAGVSLQGLGSDRVLILLDGVPLAGRLNGQLDLSRIAPSQLERIEVADGPQSTLYGSSALGGVVNLLTRSDLARRLELSATAGSFGQREARGRMAGLLGSTGGSLDIGRRTVDAIPGRVETTPGFANRWDGMARGTRAFGSAVGTLRLTRIEENQQYRSGAGTTNLNDNWQTDLLGTVTLGADAETELRAHGSVYDHRLVTRPANPAAGTKEWSLQRVADVEGIRRLAWRGHRLVVGARGEREWISSPRLSGGERHTWTGAAYGSAEWRLLAGLGLTTGVRVTSSSTWGTNATPRVGVVWQQGGLYAKAGLARGFRAPSFNEQYLDFLNGQFFYAIRGNPNLAPEHSWNATGEIGFARSGVTVYARGFGNRLRDFIETVPVGDSSGVSQFSYRNVGRARTAGAEGGAAVTRGAFTVSGSYAWLDTENESNGQPLFGRAEHTARGGVTWARGRASLRAEAVGTGRIPLSASQSGTVTYQAAGTRLNVNGTLPLPYGFLLTAGVDNAADEVPAGAVSVLGRRWFAGLAWALGR